MKSHTKSILLISTLLVGLAGPAAAALSDAESGGGPVSAGETTERINTLLNQYAGFIPGDADFRNPDPLYLSKSQQLSTFTRAKGPMTTYYTVTGGDRTATNQSGGFSGSGSDAAAPAVNSITVAHYAPDTLVGAVASGMAPTSSSGSGYSVQHGAAQQKPNQIQTTIVSLPTQISTTIVPLPQGQTHFTTTITPIPTPIPPAAALLGPGLGALGLLRMRRRSSNA